MGFIGLTTPSQHISETKDYIANTSLIINTAWLHPLRKVRMGDRILPHLYVGADVTTQFRVHTLQDIYTFLPLHSPQ